jgi:glycosyltransferase involved in cell wall biosynthesis
VPLKFATYFGVVTALLAFAYAVVLVGRTILFGIDLPGYASMMTVILFSTGAQLIAIGIIGEYVGRIFVEAKGRPLYFLDDYFSAGDDDRQHEISDV